MPAGLGYVFQPGADQQFQNGDGAQGRSGMSPQDAVKLLSLRVPERQAPSGLAPNALLQGQGGAGMMGGGNLQAIIRALMQMRGGQGMSAGMAGGLPTPRFTPGIDDPNGFGPMPTNMELQVPPGAAAFLRGRTTGGGIAGGTNFDPNSQNYNPNVSAPPLF